MDSAPIRVTLFDDLLRGSAQISHTGDMGDNPTDGPSDARWISFTELADTRGISKASASKLVRRRRWRRMTDNQGHVLILVPLDFLSQPTDTPSDDTRDSPTPGPAVSPSDISRAISALEAAMHFVESRAESAEKRAAAAEIQAKEAVNRAIRAESDLAGERNRAERAEKAAEEAQIARAAAEVDVAAAWEAESRAQKVLQALEELRAEGARRAGQGRWLRLRRAWRGE